MRHGELVAICTHLTYGDQHPAQWRQLVAQACGYRGAVVIAGDFNAEASISAARLGAAFKLAIPPAGSLATRPRTTPSEKSLHIDHVAVRGATVEAVEVLDGGGLSDHNPVQARLVL